MADRAPLLTGLGGFARACAAALVVAACTPTPQAPKATSLPSLEVRPLDAGAPRLGALVAGRPALVSLWATWCEPCRDEIPELARLDAYAREHGGSVVAIAVGESADHVTRFRQGRAMPYPGYVDEDFRFADALGERAVPATLVVDASGRIVLRAGALDARAASAFKAELARSARPQVDPQGSASSAP